MHVCISDACLGLAESAAEFFPEAGWQRCVVHWYRNLFSHVPSIKVREVAAMLKAIHDRETAGVAFDHSGGPAAATFEETLSYYSFPEEHWRRIRTNGPIIPSNASYVRSGGAPGWLALSQTANRLSTWPRHACGISPGPLGRLVD
jgi:transposase-like protein